MAPTTGSSVRRQAARLPDLIDDVRLVAVEGGPHNIA
jgi:hypothetical protein